MCDEGNATYATDRRVAFHGTFRTNWGEDFFGRKIDVA
jgi:hypothetical protein